MSFPELVQVVGRRLTFTVVLAPPVFAPTLLLPVLPRAVLARAAIAPTVLSLLLCLCVSAPSRCRAEESHNSAAESERAPSARSANQETARSASQETPAETSAPGAPVESYWGILPERSDSVTARFANRRAPLWERTLLVPYRIGGLPLRGVAAGVGTSFVYLDDHMVIDRVVRLLGPRQGPFGVAISVTAGGLTGWGGGVTLLHDSFFAPTNRAKLRTQFSADGGRRATFGLLLGRGLMSQNEVGLGYRLVPTARYFGLSPRSRRSDKSLYTEEHSWATVGHTHRWRSGFAVEGRALVSGIGTRASRNHDFPAIDSTFSGSVPNGYGRRSDAISSSIALRHDTTREDGRPERGGVRRAMLARTDGIGRDKNSFWTFRGDLEQFVPLWNSCQTLAFRGFLSWSDPIGRSEIPFQRLMVNDDPDLLRGYQDLRFRDRGMTALTVEYRWPVWADRIPHGVGFDAYLLGDVGQVFGTRADLAIDQLTVSYGGGLRFIGLAGFVGRLEVAWSDEETKIRLRADQVFQFAKGGIYHGRNPIPMR